MLVQQSVLCLLEEWCYHNYLMLKNACFQFLFLNTNFGFGHGNNAGAKISNGKYLLLLNPDTFLTNNLPIKLYQFAEKHPDFGIIGPRLIFPDGSDQISYAKFPNLKQELLYSLMFLEDAQHLVLLQLVVFLIQKVLKVE